MSRTVAGESGPDKRRGATFLHAGGQFGKEFTGFIDD